MNKIWVIAKRELSSYFVSPVAYIVIALYFFLSSFFYVLDITQSRIAEVTSILINTSFIFMLMTPGITMRLLSEEKKLGTIEFLFTSPVKVTDIVLGKFLGSVLLFLITFVLILQMPLYVILFGSPDMGPIYASLIGFVLIGCTYLAIGLFASSVSDSQLVAFIVGITVLLLFWVLGLAGQYIHNGIGNWLTSLSLLKNIENFARGVIDLKSVFYFIGMIVFFLFITVKKLEWKRW